MCGKAWVQRLSFTLICEGACKGAGAPAPAGWLDAAGAVEADVGPPAYPHRTFCVTCVTDITFPINAAWP